MTNEHLVNALRMLRRMKERGTPRHQALLAELEERMTDDRADVFNPPDDCLEDIIIGGCDNYGSLSGCETFSRP